MNKTILTGRLTTEPDVKYTTGQEPMAIAMYTLAVQRDFKNKDGKYEADFIRCKAFNKRGEFAEKYLHKGMKILVEGRLQSGSYEKDGQTHYTTDLIVDRHEFCESRKDSQPHGQSQPQQYNEYDNGIPEGFQAITDDDIPF